MQAIIALLLLIALTGCASQEIQHKDGLASARSFSPANLAKIDGDMMAEINQREMLKTLKLLTGKLYRRNPQEFRKAGQESAESASALIFEQVPKWAESPLTQPNWEENFKLAFLDGYSGDRIHAFMGALTSMLMASYNYKTEFFLTDSLSAQKLYNSARNIEVAAWKLSNAKLPNGAKVLLSNSIEGDLSNLSFEREFGKLIAQQDLMALIIEDQSNRSITRVIQNVATFVFLPI
jgi:hypothetical protein